MVESVKLDNQERGLVRFLSLSNWWRGDIVSRDRGQGMEGIHLACLAQLSISPTEKQMPEKMTLLSD